MIGYLMKSENIFFQFLSSIQEIIRALDAAGGIPYFVGGCVRDLVLGRALKDFDIEVHKLSLEQLQNILEQFGHVRLVGKKFGVLRIDGFDVDWSLPRRDSKGRKPVVQIDPTMTIADACKRRDVTMNALALDARRALELLDGASENDFLLSGSRRNFVTLTTDGDRPIVLRDAEHRLEGLSGQNDLQQKLVAQIIDPWGGLEDINHKRLRAVDAELFVQDPLRFFRVMHFVGRFQMEPDNELNRICAAMELRDTELDVPLARERICEEFKKLLLRSREPSRGFVWLYKVGRLQEILPELARLIGVQQRPDYHPEGDVFVHTMQALDFAAQYHDYRDGVCGDAVREKLIILLGILCHDLGKADTTLPDLTAHGHAEAGVPLAQSLLKLITNDHEIVSMVCQLTKYHLLPFSFVREQAGLRSYRRLALKLKYPLTLRQLGLVALFDAQGRCGAGKDPRAEAFENFTQFMHQAEQASVAQGPEQPVLLGRHLQDLIAPGPRMGELLKRAYHIQIEEGIKDIEELKRRVLE